MQRMKDRCFYKHKAHIVSHAGALDASYNRVGKTDFENILDTVPLKTGWVGENIQFRIIPVKNG